MRSPPVPRTTSSAPPSWRATWSPSGACRTSLGRSPTREETGEVFLGRSVTQHKQVSDVTAHAIDEEVRRVIESNYTARQRDPRRPISTSCTSWPRRSSSTRPSTRSRSRTSWPAARRKPPADWDDTLSNEPPRGAGRAARRRRSADPGGTALTVARRAASSRLTGGVAPCRASDLRRAVALRGSDPRSDAARSSWACSTSRPIPSPTAAALPASDAAVGARGCAWPRRARPSSTSAASRRARGRGRSTSRGGAASACCR